MQLNLAVLDPPDPAPGPASTEASPTPWGQVDEAARMAALDILARLIAAMLAAEPAKEASHE